MRVLVDTCVWSIAFRGDDARNKSTCEELEMLINENRVDIIGPIKQEILSAYKETQRFEKIKRHLEYFPSLTPIDDDYIAAAKFYALCRSNGVQGSHIDLLSCAVSVRVRSCIFTFDRDFEFYSQFLPIVIYKSQGWKDFLDLNQ